MGEENGEYDDLEDPERQDETIMDLSPRKIAVRKALLSKEAAELLKSGGADGSLGKTLCRHRTATCRGFYIKFLSAKTETSRIISTLL